MYYVSPSSGQHVNLQSVISKHTTIFQLTRFLNGHLQVAELSGPLPGLLAASLSPCGKYLQTYQRPAHGAGNTEKNLKVVQFQTLSSHLK